MATSAPNSLPPEWQHFRIITWFYVLSRAGAFHRVTAKWADPLLSRVLPPDHSPIPREWQHPLGRVTLFGAVLIRHRRRTLYVDRAHLSLHALTSENAEEAVQAHWPWQAFAQQLIEDTGASSRVNYTDSLGDFLSWSSMCVLPDDVHRLLHETPAEVHRLWLQVLVAGQHSHPLWDLRTGLLHPAFVPIVC